MKQDEWQFWGKMTVCVLAVIAGIWLALTAYIGKMPPSPPEPEVQTSTFDWRAP